MGILLKRLFDDMNRTGRRYVFTGGGDSTFNRGNGFGEWGAILEQSKAYAPCVGGMGGMNVSASGMNYLWAMKRQGNTAVGATTAPADAECLGGVVCPTGWTGFQHCLLAAAGTTISSTNWNWTANASFMNTQGRVVASMFTRAMSGATDANTGYTPFISGGSALDASSSQNGTRQSGGSIVNTSTAPVGTLRRTDMESDAITSTAASGSGASACIGDGSLRLGGPALFQYVAITSKDTPKGWWASKHISLGGKALYDYIKEGLNTTNYANSIETYFKCMLLLNDTTYANSYGGCQGDVTPGGLGGANLAIGCAWFDCFGHNDVGSAGDVSSFVPYNGPSWAVESSSTITGITDAGAGLSIVQLTSTSGFDSSGHIHVLGGAIATDEIITYTSIVGNELRGCTFGAYNSTAGTRVSAMAAQGYKSYTATGFAANNFFWDEWIRARWVAAGGDNQNFKRFLKAPNPVSDTTAVASTTVTTLLEREERHQRMIEAVRAYPPSPYTELIDPRRYVTAAECVVNRWCDPITNGVTVAVAGVTSTAGDTINLNLGSPVLGTYGVGRIGSEAIKWTGKSGNNPTGCTRGAFGTTAYDLNTASHASGRDFVECDMIHNSTVGYQEIWRRIFVAELGTRKTILNGAA